MIFIFYFLESRFFLIGKNLYPSYNIIQNFIRESSINKKSEIAEGQVNSTPDGIISDTIVYSDYYTWHSESHWKRGFSDIPLL
ncbi:MAG: hypothetical protein FJW66_04995, partial [Actinobacteria bacterium]|nr:hypothetical protein [Actinomycetota bacterium]